MTARFCVDGLDPASSPDWASRSRCARRSQEPLHGDVLVEHGPVHAKPVADEPPRRSLGGRSVVQLGKPLDGYVDGAAVAKAHDELIADEGDCRCARFLRCRSAHATCPLTLSDARTRSV